MTKRVSELVIKDHSRSLKGANKKKKNFTDKLIFPNGLAQLALKLLAQIFWQDVRNLS